MRGQHLFHVPRRQLDIHQRPVTHSRAPFFGLFPFHRVIEQVGPVGKGLALQGFDSVNSTAAATQESALHVAGNTQTPQFLRAVQLLFLEGVGCQAQMGGYAEMVRFGQVDEAPLVTTIDAAALALEALLRFW